MREALNRINELQQETIDKADQVQGSKEYVSAQMKLYAEAEKHRIELNFIIQQQEMIAEKFVSVGKHSIWPPRAFTLSQQKHQHLATVSVS